jgi:hypothetical protein
MVSSVLVNVYISFIPFESGETSTAPSWDVKCPHDARTELTMLTHCSHKRSFGTVMMNSIMNEANNAVATLVCLTISDLGEHEEIDNLRRVTRMQPYWVNRKLALSMCFPRYSTIVPILPHRRNSRCEPTRSALVLARTQRQSTDS